MIKELFLLWEQLPLEKNIVVLCGEEFQEQLNEELFSPVSQQYQIEDFLNIDSLITKPYDLWRWIEYAQKVIKQQPVHDLNVSLAKLQSFFHTKFMLITTNIDGLYSSQNMHQILEVNGSIFKVKEFNDEHLKHINIDWSNIPTNKQGKLLRPDISLQGEKIDRKRKIQANVIAQQADLFIIIGHKLNTEFSYELPWQSKKYNNAKVIEINYKSIFEEADVFLKANKQDIFPIMVNIMIELQESNLMENKRK